MTCINRTCCHPSTGRGRSAHRVLFVLFSTVIVSLLGGCGTVTQRPVPQHEVEPTDFEIESDEMELVHALGGAIYAMAIRDDVAIVAAGLHLIALDLSDPSAPRPIASSATLESVPKDIEWIGDRLYVAMEYRLAYMDIQRPELIEGRPLESLFQEDIERYFGLVLEGSILFVVGADGWDPLVRTLDVRDPLQPKRLGDLAASDVVHSYHLRDLVIDGGSGLAYGVAYNPILDSGHHGTSLMMLDVSDPAVPRALSIAFTDTPGRGIGIGSRWLGSAGVARIGESIVLLSAIEGSRVFDVRDPRAPVLLGSGKEALSSLLVVDDLIVGGGPTGLQGFTPTPATELRSAWQIPELGSTAVQSVIRRAGDRLYFASRATFSILQFQPDGPPALLGRFALDIPPIEHLAYFDGHLAAAGDFELRIVTLDDGTSPQVVYSESTDQELVGIGYWAQHLYVGWADGLQVLDISEPSEPILLGTLAVSPDTFRVDDGRAAVQVGTDLLLFDLRTNPLPRMPVATIEDIGAIADLELDGSRLAVSRYEFTDHASSILPDDPPGIRTFDVSTLDQPVELSGLDPNYRNAEAAWLDDTLLIGNSRRIAAFVPRRDTPPDATGEWHYHTLPGWDARLESRFWGPRIRRFGAHVAVFSDQFFGIVSLQDPPATRWLVIEDRYGADYLDFAVDWGARSIYLANGDGGLVGFKLH